jgi:DNA repair protein SbcC/Rad50
MFLSLDIENIQGHRKSHLDFHKGVNVIIGESAAGKTTILRALRLLRWNKPLGGKLISWWADSSKIEVATSEGDVVKRIDGAEKAYYLNDSDPFKAFKTDVPDEIANALRMDPFNLQRQFDKFFLLADTPGEVAQHFNRIAHLDKIDISQSNLRKWIARIQSNIKYKRSDLEKKTKQLETFSFIDEMEEKVEELEDLETRNNVLLKGIKSMKNLRSSIKEIMHDNELNQQYVNLSPIIKKITDLQELNMSRRVWIENANMLRSRIVKSEDEISTHRKTVLAKPIVNSISVLLKHTSKIEDKLESAEALKQTIKELQSDILELGRRKQVLQDRFDANFPDVCPLCGKPKDETHAHKNNS